MRNKWEESNNNCNNKKIVPNLLQTIKAFSKRWNCFSHINIVWAHIRTFLRFLFAISFVGSMCVCVGFFLIFIQSTNQHPPVFFSTLNAETEDGEISHAEKICLARFTINRHNSTSLHFIRARTHHFLISCVFVCVYPCVFFFSNLNCSLSWREKNGKERNEVPFYVNWRAENSRRKNMLLAKIHALCNGWKTSEEGMVQLLTKKRQRASTTMTTTTHTKN